MNLNINNEIQRLIVINMINEIIVVLSQLYAARESDHANRSILLKESEVLVGKSLDATEQEVRAFVNRLQKIFPGEIQISQEGDIDIKNKETYVTEIVSKWEQKYYKMMGITPPAVEEPVLHYPRHRSASADLDKYDGQYILNLNFLAKRAKDLCDQSGESLPASTVKVITVPGATIKSSRGDKDYQVKIELGPTYFSLNLEEHRKSICFDLRGNLKFILKGGRLVPITEKNVREAIVSEFCNSLKAAAKPMGVDEYLKLIKEQLETAVFVMAGTKAEHDEQKKLKEILKSSLPEDAKKKAYDDMAAKLNVEKKLRLSTLHGKDLRGKDRYYRDIYNIEDILQRSPESKEEFLRKNIGYFRNEYSHIDEITTLNLDVKLSRRP